MASSRLHLSIDSWLERLDLPNYRLFFKEYASVEEILWMNERYLKDLGIKNGGHRARIISSLTILREKFEKLSRDCFDGKTLRGSSRLEERNKSFSSLPYASPVKIERQHSGIRSWPSSVPSSSPQSHHSSPRLSMNAGSDMSSDELKNALEQELKLDSSDLRSHAWYHGTILRQRAEELVTQDGDFLVRDCISQPGDFVITCKWKSVPLHFIIRKIVLNPDKLYERIQYCFEKESFDTIQDFITYYAGGKQPLSESSGVILGSPINRTMPLTYYSSRFGVQCQVHYAAKKLESLSPQLNSRPSECFSSESPSIAEDCSFNKSILHPHDQKSSPVLSLTRVGSDPMLSPSTLRRNVEHRPHSGSFSSEIMVVLQGTDKPPPKPSRVPSRRWAEKPAMKKKLIVSTNQQSSNSADCSISLGPPFKHRAIARKPSETRFSFLDHPNVSDDTSNVSKEDFLLFTVPSMDWPSIFDPQNFSSDLLNDQNLPLEGTVLSKVKEIILSVPSRTLAANLMCMDLQAAKNAEVVDLGLGVTNGLELLLLPQGEQLQKDLIERTECLKLFIATSLLTTPAENQRVELLNKWINVAMETRSSAGNLFGFTSIMLGLTIPEISELHSTWLSLRRTYTESAYAFEARLRPAFVALQQASGVEAPNTCLPYLLSLLLILQKHKSMMDLIEENIFSEKFNDTEFDLEIPGCINCSDYGLQLLANHLEMGRFIMQQYPTFLQNGKTILQKFPIEKSIRDIFSTEFHLRILWGSRGAIVNAKERHKKFQKVLFLLHRKCCESLS